MADPTITIPLPLEGVEVYHADVSGFSGVVTVKVRLIVAGAKGAWSTATLTSGIATWLAAGASAASPDPSSIVVTGAIGAVVGVEFLLLSGLEQIIRAGNSIQIVEAV